MFGGDFQRTDDGCQLTVAPEEDSEGVAPGGWRGVGTRGQVQLVFTVLDDPADPATGQAARRDECMAYLSHTVSHYDDLAQATLFLHGDPSDHTPFGLLNLVVRGLALGTFSQLDFVHLGSPRMVATYNPCQDDIYQRAFDREPQHRLFTYCCSQFLVSQRRIRARPLTDYVRMLQLVDGTVPDQCAAWRHGGAVEGVGSHGGVRP
eukprot:Skav236132  [mRNA]  locus=scaffold3100:96057:108602:- [translate_table: standard]